MNTQKAYKQQGTALIMSLLMLIIMTIVGVTAIKTSSIDVLMAHNDQRQMMLFQKKESALIKFVSPATLLLPWLKIDNAKFTNNEYVAQPPVVDKTTVIAKITDLRKMVSCRGVNNQATEIGAAAPPCRLFDFNISLKSQFKGAAYAAGSRGVGKEVPAANKYVLGE